MAYKHVRANTAQGLVAVRTDFGLTYVTQERAHLLCRLYGGHIVGRDTAEQERAQYVNKTPLTGRRVIIKRAS